jgi:hypothetical protein
MDAAVTVPSVAFPESEESFVNAWLGDDMLFGFNGSLQDSILYN